MSARPACGVVAVAALDLRRAPDHRAELGSQLLLGEVVDRLSGWQRAGWVRVRGRADGYEGWVRSWGLVEASAARARRWERRASAVVREPFATARARPGGGVAVSPLFLGCRLIPGRRRGGYRAVELPDGRRGWVRAAALGPAGAPPPPLQGRIASLLGSPYLWGGRTPAGLDCSALVQLVLGERGVRLPRDARDQFEVCAPVPADSPVVPGDLAFFAARGRPPGHVGIALGDGYFGHSRGRVEIAHVDPHNQLCANDLIPQFLGWFRPPRPARAARGWHSRLDTR